MAGLSVGLVDAFKRIDPHILRTLGRQIGKSITNAAVAQIINSAGRIDRVDVTFSVAPPSPPPPEIEGRGVQCARDDE
jgi:hypothetical protein